jgi:imidazolonepropionase
MLPTIKSKKLAEYCDVFCENGCFDYDFFMTILKAAKKLRYKVILHADEF